MTQTTTTGDVPSESVLLTVGGRRVQSFPLFFALEQRRQLLQPEEQETVSNSERQEVVEEVKKMDKLHHELVYAIIRFYHLCYDSGNFMELPYHMKKGKAQTYRIDLGDLPAPLTRLLTIFAEWHRTQDDRMRV